MELMNPEQLVCIGCRRPVIDTADGWIHLDGSLIDECGAYVAEVAA